MSEHIQASQEELQIYVEQMKDALQFGVGQHIMGIHDRDREITYEDDLPIMFATGFFFFCKGEHVLRHAPEAALTLNIRPHYDLEFRYSPAHLMPGYANEEEMREDIYDTTISDEYRVERALVQITSEHCMLYSVDNADECTEEDELQYGAEIDTDFEFGYDMDRNPMTPEQLTQAMEQPYEITSEICEALGVIASKLGIINEIEDLEGLNDENKQGYEALDTF